MTIQHVPTRARCSIMRIEKLNLRKKQSLGRGVYGVFLIGTAIVLMAIDPVKTITSLFMRMEEGTFIFRMWQNPPYTLYSHVHVFNYSNVDAFLRGDAPRLQLDEIGPFVYEEKRLNLNMSVDPARKVLSLVPNTSLVFRPELSVADTKDLRVIVPNLALIALSTLAADTMPWWTNQLVATLIRGLGSKLFLNLTVEEYMWGYKDPLVKLAKSVAPGWIDFGDVGILDRFYDQKTAKMEVQLSNENNDMYSILSWDGSSGLKEQGYTDDNSSVLCNRVKGAYEGMMMPPGVTPETDIRLFRKQACRVYPFRFDKEDVTDIGVPYYRFVLEESAFNSTSPFACKCRGPCLPDGFVDISRCFYDFPVSLSKPHFLDVDPREAARYDGLRPDPPAQSTFMDFEPNLGIPVNLRSTVQANIAVRTSPYNAITQPLDKHHLPLIWISMFCGKIPDNVTLLLQLRVKYGPPAAVIFEVVMFLLGCWLLGTSVYRQLRPRKSFANRVGEEKEKELQDEESENGEKGEEMALL